MPNIALILKKEISRIIRKELKQALTPTEKTISALKKIISEQKKQIQALEKTSAKLSEKLLSKGKIKADPSVKAERHNVTGKSIFKLRKKLRLNRIQMAEIIGVNPNSVFLWEKGKISPRAEAKAKIVKLRTMSLRDIKELYPPKISPIPKKTKKRKKAVKQQIETTPIIPVTVPESVETKIN